MIAKLENIILITFPVNCSLFYLENSKKFLLFFSLFAIEWLWNSPAKTCCLFSLLTQTITISEAIDFLKMDDIYSSTIFANTTSSLDFGEGAQMGELGGDEGVGGMGGGGDLDWFHFLFEVFLIFICVVTTLLNLVLMVAIATQSATDSRSQSTPNYAYLIALNLTIINFLVGVCG